MVIIKGVIIGLVVLSQSYFAFVKCGPCTYSICDWEPWDPWNSCSQTCGGGRRSRSRLLCCNTAWNIDECKSNCGLTTSGFYDYQDCNEVCYNGGTYTGSRCSCKAGYYDSCCNSRITCGSPPSIQHGTFSASHHNYGGTVTYRCDTNYNMTSGSSTRTCSQSWSSGFWSGFTPTCQYVRTCLSNPCQNGGTCIDGIERYTCSCGFGWSGTNCEFDIIAPEVTGCSGNITRRSDATTLHIQWPVPVFSDPRNTKLVTSSNYQTNQSTFSWGEYGVQYVADKPSNGLRTICLFYVNFYPFECDEIDPPENGAVASNGWNKRFTEVSTIFCKDGFHFDIYNKLDTVYVCGGSGQWLPPIPDDLTCKEDIPSADPLSMHHYTNTDEIAGKYLSILKSSNVEAMCTSPQWDGQCKQDNVIVIQNH